MDVQTEVGSVVALWRYPVKSMQGEQLGRAELHDRGVLGDRAYAIRDCATGHIASAKYPRKWSALLACRARFAAPPQPHAPPPPVWITLPDGSEVRSDQADIDLILSQVLGHDVRLISSAPDAPVREADRTPLDAPPDQAVIRTEQMGLAAPAGTFFDYAPVHLLTTATLDQLRHLHPGGNFDQRRFRPNILITPAGDRPRFAEHAWLGAALTIGTAQLRVIDPCPRCVVTTLPQADLPRDPGVLRTISQHTAAASVTAAPGAILSAVAGVYAQVIHPGTIGYGDAVWIGS